MIYYNKSAFQYILDFFQLIALFFSWQGRALTKTPILQLIRSLEKMEITHYLRHIINLGLELCWKKRFLSKKLNLGHKYFFLV